MGMAAGRTIARARRLAYTRAIMLMAADILQMSHEEREKIEAVAYRELYRNCTSIFERLGISIAPYEQLVAGFVAKYLEPADFKAQNLTTGHTSNTPQNGVPEATQQKLQLCFCKHLMDQHGVAGCRICYCQRHLNIPSPV